MDYAGGSRAGRRQGSVPYSAGQGPWGLESEEDPEPRAGGGRLLDFWPVKACKVLKKKNSPEEDVTFS